MVVEIVSIQGLVLTILTFIVGYVVLFGGFRAGNKLPAFYEVTSFDKSIQSLIIGVALLLFSLNTFNISLSITSIISNFYIILSAELFYGYVVLMLIANNLNHIYPLRRSS